MQKEFTKVDDETIEVTITAPPVVTTIKYTGAYLANQKTAIIANKEADMARRDAEIDEVNELLEKCRELGVNTEPPQPPEVTNDNIE